MSKPTRRNFLQAAAAALASLPFASQLFSQPQKTPLYDKLVKEFKDAGIVIDRERSDALDWVHIKDDRGGGTLTFSHAKMLNPGLLFLDGEVRFEQVIQIWEHRRTKQRMYIGGRQQSTVSAKRVIGARTNFDWLLDTTKAARHDNAWRLTIDNVDYAIGYAAITQIGSSVESWDVTEQPRSYPDPFEQATPSQLLAVSDSMACYLLSFPVDSRRLYLDDLKRQNEVMHSLVQARMVAMRQVADGLPASQASMMIADDVSMLISRFDRVVEPVKAINGVTLATDGSIELVAGDGVRLTKMANGTIRFEA